VVLVLATGLIFSAFEVGQYIAVAPALATELSPAVIVLALTAYNIQQAVD